MRRRDWVTIAMTAALGACGGTPPGRCLEPHIYVGQCIVRSVSVRDGQSGVGLDLDGSAQPPFAISVRRPGSAAEVSMLGGHSIARAGVHAAHPAFDVTPHGLITAWITERGVIEPPFEENLRRTLQVNSYEL